MSGNSIVADTSLLVNFFNGVELARKVMAGRRIWISCITEIEILGYEQLSNDDIKLIRAFLDECHIVELDNSIRQKAIEIRRSSKLKIPDVIIAATAITLDIPLITLDSDFEQIQTLDSVILKLE